MNDSVGTWGLSPWFPDHGASLIHPEDADHHALLGPMGPYGDGTTRFAHLPAPYRYRPRFRAGSHGHIKQYQDAGRAGDNPSTGAAYIAVALPRLPLWRA